MVIRLLPHFMQKVIESKVHEFSEIFIGYKLCLEKNGRNVAQISIQDFIPIQERLKWKHIDHKPNSLSFDPLFFFQNFAQINIQEFIESKLCITGSYKQYPVRFWRKQKHLGGNNTIFFLHEMMKMLASSYLDDLHFFLQTLGKYAS